jgi:hypothetical protein
MLLVIHFQRRDVRNADSVVEIKANNATDAGKSQYRNSQRLREDRETRAVSKVGPAVGRRSASFFLPSLLHVCVCVCIKVIHLSKIPRKHELMVHWMETLKPFGPHPSVRCSFQIELSLKSASALTIMKRERALYPTNRPKTDV